MAKQLLRNFTVCGLAGWCMEIIFTAFNSLRRWNFRLTATTSLWMFPIYGSAAFLKPLFVLLREKSVWLRGFLYMGIIFAAEFISGTLLTRREICPWDYGRSRSNIGRVIRLDFAPLWFLAGLFFERVLTGRQTD